jgi:heme A synthase
MAIFSYETLGMLLTPLFYLLELHKQFQHIGLMLALLAFLLLEWIFARALLDKLKDGESLLSAPTLIIVGLHFVCAGVQQMVAGGFQFDNHRFQAGLAIVIIDFLIAFALVFTTKDKKSNEASAICSAFGIVMVSLSLYSL